MNIRKKRTMIAASIFLCFLMMTFTFAMKYHMISDETEPRESEEKATSDKRKESAEESEDAKAEAEEPQTKTSLTDLYPNIRNIGRVNSSLHLRLTILSTVIMGFTGRIREKNIWPRHGSGALITMIGRFIQSMKAVTIIIARKSQFFHFQRSLSIRLWAATRCRKLC